MTAMDKYFVVEPGAEPHGPYPLPEIADLLAAGTVTPRAVLRKAGDASAPPRPTVIDVAPVEPASPPPPVAAAEPAPVDHTNKIEPLDEGWEGETEIHDEAPAQAAPPPIPPSVAAPMGAPPGVTPHPHHRAPRGTQPPPTAYPSTALAVTADPRPRAEPHAPPPFAPAPQAYAQPQLAKPAEDPPPVRDPKRRIAVGVGIGVVVAIGGIGLAIALRSPARPNVKNALVRVSTQTGTGTGFLIDGPDEYIYVATANHLIDRGERVLVERDVNVSEKKSYVEAYPETEIVATDPDADLAIIRVKNVEAKRFARLPLAKEPVKDAKIFSYGYPGSSLAKHAGLVSKDGKILSLVRFPAYDDRYARVLRENAVDGLLVSTDIEPGFSGGPTTNEAGEVVGINVTKDRAHVGQNGAVSVVALRELLAKVQPASKQVEPTAEDIVALLKRVQSEYLLLPLEERSRVRETDFLAASDLPSLRRFVNEIRQEERNTDSSFIAKFRLSGQAALGMYFARLPGNLLETYRAPSTRSAITSCALANQRLASFFGELETSVGKRQQQPLVDSCDELGVRPLAWDLAAATLQWDGKEKDVTVTKLDRMDDEGRIYRASVRMSGASNLIELWFGIEQGKPRLKLFDSANELYAIDSPRTVSTAALQGTWGMKRPRVTDAVDKNAEVESEEKVSISIGEEHRVSILYTSTQKYYAVTKRSAFPCSRKSTMELGLAESFTGTLENGVVIAMPEKAATPVGADSDYCTNRRLPDQIIAIKLVGDQLYLYRTDGTAYPETIQLAKL